MIGQGSVCPKPFRPLLRGLRESRSPSVLSLLERRPKTIEFMNAVFALPAVTRKSASAAPETEESDVNHPKSLGARAG